MADDNPNVDKPKIGRPPHVPTPQQREMVRRLAGFGFNLDDIAITVGVSKDSIKVHYKDECRIGRVVANARVCGELFKKCMEGNMTAIIWWTKTRMGWSERIKAEITGADGGPVQLSAMTKDPSKMTDAELDAEIAVLKAGRAVAELAAHSDTQDQDEQSDLESGAIQTSAA
jgi:hypothetical protein